MTKWRYFDKDEWGDAITPRWTNRISTWEPDPNTWYTVDIFIEDDNSIDTQLHLDLDGQSLTREQIVELRDELQAVIDKLDEITKG